MLIQYKMGTDNCTALYRVDGRGQWVKSATLAKKVGNGTFIVFNEHLEDKVEGIIKVSGTTVRARTAASYFTAGQSFAFNEGDEIICNGYKRRITKIHTGQLEGMLECHDCCVDATFPTCYPLFD